ncbi:MAG: bifunctional transaldolase/phosoglucose isomerase [Chloroflexota bacterium]
MKTSIARVNELGQSLWYDNIQRRLLENGDMAAMISRGEIRGVTSNPSIFNQAIAKSNDYDSALIPLAWSGRDAEQIFWQLAIEDICSACDLFKGIYEGTNGGDGFVSLEVSPYLAHNSQATLEQAKHLWRAVDRPNLMIKIPATLAGLPAIRQAIAAGININVTLIFSIDRYRQVMDAYLSGLEDRVSAKCSIDRIASVASFFVSRMDTNIDAVLPQGSPLRGRAGVANSKLAYEEFGKVFSGERFRQLAEAGARTQRPLWASTSTKNPAYPDTIYIDSLIGLDSVNTVPPHTLDAFRDHGVAELSITEGVEEARQLLNELEDVGISLAQVTQQLEEEGVSSFEAAFADLLKTIDSRRTVALAQLGPLAVSVERQVAGLVATSVTERIWNHDPGLWTNDPDGQEEARARLGWLRLPLASKSMLGELSALVGEVSGAGLDRVLLLGMGGSSLAPEVLSLAFGHPTIPFAILDSSDPAQVRRAGQDFPPGTTLYIVSSKSGGTVEVKAMFDYFWNLTNEDGSRFIAITDPGSSLEALASAHKFRRTFLADPSVGGRFSALSHFGLVPAALLGLDVARLLERAEWMMKQCQADVPGYRNPGLVLGTVLGQAAIAGRDKFTVLADPACAAFGSWLEQLIAESTGKQGKGIVVIDGEPVKDPDGYRDDRLFVYLRHDGSLDSHTSSLREAGLPVLEFDFTDPYDLGAEFYRWEFATAIACSILGVNAFDQPDVQETKDRTKAILVSHSQNSRLIKGPRIWAKDGIAVYSPQSLAGASLPEIILGFLSLAKEGDYIAINAYLPRTEEMTSQLSQLRKAIFERTGQATMLGFGPRFLHSTGQLHKGGPNSGLFIQITAEPEADIEIPGQGITFGALQRAQATGDYEALAGRDRRILQIHLQSKTLLFNLLVPGQADSD